MKTRLFCALALIAALGNVSATTLAQTAPPVGSADWPQANYDYANTRAATNSRISSANVGQLGVAWTFGVAGASTFGALATSPVVVNGTVYLQDLKSNVYAIDLQSGALKWQKLYNADQMGPNGPAVDGGKVFVESDPQTVAALDANTGEELWSVSIAPPPNQGLDQQIAAYAGTLYVSTVPGTSSQNFYVAGGMGIIYALDEQDGSMKWSFNTVKDGDLWGHPEVNSGGGAWYPPAIDTATGVTYWGIGNPGPWPGTPEYPNGASRPGPNLYTSSELALDGSGQLQWYQQMNPHDLSDYDFEASPILATASNRGASRNVVIGAGKGGYVAGFDKQTGEQLWKTAVGAHQNDNLESFPTDSNVTVLPGPLGGVETPMAFADGTIYVPVVNASSDFSGTTFSVPDFNNATGELDALDAATGTILWKADLAAADLGGATVAGDLVFTSTYGGQALAFDRSSGKQLWTWKAAGRINGLTSVVGDTVLVPVGLASPPQLVALRIGAAAQTTPQPTATSTNPPAGTAPAAGVSKLSVGTPANSPLSFDTTTLKAAAGAQVTVQYTNDSTVPHNWHLFDGADANAPSLAQTPIKSGPGDVETVQFTAPTQAGSYFYVCDVHPTLMTGHLVVN